MAFNKSLDIKLSSKSEKNKKLSKLDLFKQLAALNKDTGECRIVDKAEFINEYADLNFTNGGDFCRRSSFTKAPNNYKIATATSTGKIKLLWNADDDEKTNVEQYFRLNCNFVNTKDKKDKERNRSNTGIKYIKSFGYVESSNATRAIRKDILEFYKSQSCVGCGSNSELQCDHKNGLYNDPRILNLETQTVNDFQSLCRHCNCQKRQVEKNSKSTCKRYGATNIPHMRAFGIDFIEGDDTLDINNPNALRGTYWYDPIEFTKYIHMRLQRVLNPIPIHNNINIIEEMAKMSINEKEKL